MSNKTEQIKRKVSFPHMGTISYVFDSSAI